MYDHFIGVPYLTCANTPATPRSTALIAVSIASSDGPSVPRAHSARCADDHRLRLQLCLLNVLMCCMSITTPIHITYPATPRPCHDSAPALAPTLSASTCQHRRSGPQRAVARQSRRAEGLRQRRDRGAAQCLAHQATTSPTTSSWTRLPPARLSRPASSSDHAVPRRCRPVAARSRSCSPVLAAVDTQSIRRARVRRVCATEGNEIGRGWLSDAACGCPLPPARESAGRWKPDDDCRNVDVVRYTARYLPYYYACMTLPMPLCPVAPTLWDCCARSALCECAPQQLPR